LVRFGGYSDVVIVPEKPAFAKPASLFHEQAAAIPVNYLTAWQLLVVLGALKPEETALVHNAGGGVGLAATTSRATSAPRSTARQAAANTPA
jgi:NADPH:quinone reductase-like Zn-dependent oxidoreductase